VVMVVNFESATIAAIRSAATAAIRHVFGDNGGPRVFLSPYASDVAESTRSWKGVAI